jgi:hypothetical protein
MSARECASCGHRENEHRGNGACIAIVEDGDEVSICRCNDYEPSRAPARSTLRNVGERGRAHERKMRRLRPIVFARDGYRCTARVSEGCSGHAEHPHHLWPTGQGGPDVEENLASVCCSCHDWIHQEHPAEARTLGLLRDRL